VLGQFNTIIDAMLGHFETIGSISPEKMLGHFKAFDATNYFFMMLALNVYISMGVFIMILKLLEHLCSYFIDPKTVRACWASSDSLYPCKGSNPRLQAAWKYGKSHHSTKLSIAEFWGSWASHV